PQNSPLTLTVEPLYYFTKFMSSKLLLANQKRTTQNRFDAYNSLPPERGPRAPYFPITDEDSSLTGNAYGLARSSASPDSNHTALLLLRPESADSTDHFRSVRR